MQINEKENENYYPDKTYQNHAGSGTIKTVSKIKPKRKQPSNFSFGNSTVKTTGSEQIVIRQCYNRALISVRKRKTGYLIVVTRQPNTTEESHVLAKELQKEMNEELKSNDYFVNDDNGFQAWFSKKEEVLKNNGFHKLKD